ncbi:MAG: FecR domain-containing protein [Candidatus Brevundimonas colombiensis]|uniref:FecR domain-containing protein n=1 Tax=Candidatus Brevundimonas colombiensis TaxID=3121376 RepID=A0AAJ5X153_9CAUL|nr:FecR domain-containing protein [Brevundimonas sp.]WEK40094.1 MAG: FecR domain-containing protein [Brevundimonas sp.]
MQEATEWFVQLHEDPRDDQLRPHFEAWRAADPRHADAYERVRRLWGAAAHLPALARAPARPDRRAVLTGVAGLGGAAMAVAATGRLVLGPHPFADYRTRAGEVLQVTLQDGSNVTLSTASALEIDISATARRLRLLQGEAWFETASDAGRRLSVEAAGATVSAADAAAFGVRLVGGCGRLSVARQAVALSLAGQSRQFGADKTALFDRTGIGAVSDLDVNDWAWRDGQLVFINRPLAEVLAGLDRWTGLRTLIRGRDLAARPVTLITRTRDAAAGLEQLSRAIPIRIEHLPGLTIVREM